jgi:hypothetical protein
MELKQYWKIALRWWWLIVLPPLLVGASGLAAYRAPAGTFTAALRFTAAQPDAVTASPNFDPNYYRWLTSEYIVSALKDWARTGAFAQAVSDELKAQGTDIPAAVLGGAISSDSARSILVIYLNWPEQTPLLKIAEAVSTVLQDRNAAVFPQLGGQAAKVVGLDSPAAGAVPPSLRSRLDLPLKAGLAFAVGLALALLAHYFDPFVREPGELEGMGLKVLAEVPRHSA